MQGRCNADVDGIVVGEPALERVGVLEDLLQAAEHGHHLKYFRRAVIVWAMTGPRSVSIRGCLAAGLLDRPRLHLSPIVWMPAHRLFLGASRLTLTQQGVQVSPPRPT